MKKLPRRSVFATVASMAFLLCECAADAPPAPHTASPTASSANSTAGAAKTTDTPSIPGTVTASTTSTTTDETKNKDNPPPTGTETSGDGADGQNLADPPGDAGDAEVTKLLEDCGATDVINAPPQKVVLEKHMFAIPFTRQEFTVTATLSGTLDIVTNGIGTTMTDTISVSALTGLFHLFAGGTAAAQAAAVSGTIEMTSVPFKDMGNLAKYPQYKGIVCTIIPATQIVNRTGGKTTTVTFETPVPSAISPRAIAARYATELGDKKVFDHLTATVVSSDNPVLQGKSNLTGSVTVEKVSPNFLKITADTAFKVTSTFESPDVTNAIGLVPVLTYYMKNRDLIAVVVDTSGVTGGQLVNFLDTSTVTQP